MKNKKLILIFLLALGARLGLLYMSHDVLDGSGMSLGYANVARNLLLGRGFVLSDESFLRELPNNQSKRGKLLDVEDYLPGIPTSQDVSLKPEVNRMTGYSVLLAMTYLIFGQQRYIYLQVIQAIVDSLSVFMIFWIAGIIFNRKIGLLSAFLFAIYWPEVRAAVSALHWAWMPFITVLATYLLIRASVDESKKIKIYILIGLIIAVGTYIHALMVLLPVFFGIGIIFNKGFRKGLIATGIMMSTVILLLIPWIIRNYKIFHRFIPTAVTLWQATWEGFGEFKNPFGAVLDDGATYKMVIDEGYNVEYGSLEFSDVLKEKVLKVIREHPFWYIGSVIKRTFKVTLFLRPDLGIYSMPYWNKYKDKGGTVLGYFKEYPRQFIIRLISMFITGITFLTALVGIWLTRAKLKTTILLVMVPFYFIAEIAPLAADSPAYILPGHFVFLIFTAISLEYLYQRWRILHTRKTTG
jgi:hypothetical protein